MDRPHFVTNMLNEIYRTSFEWAKLGGQIIEHPFGVTVYNLNHPEYNENNCLWYFDPGLADESTFQVVVAEFESLGVSCSQWVPSPSANLDLCDTYFRVHEMADSPGEGLLLDLDREYHADARICVKRSNKQSLSQVYFLSGQRSTSTVTRNKALSLSGIANYESYVCYWDGELAGRAGLLRVSGKVARLKSIFVGATFRRQGVASSLIRVIATKARELGYRYLASEVDPSNEASLECHQKLGFKTAGLVHAYR